MFDIKMRLLHQSKRTNFKQNSRLTHCALCEREAVEM
jgi:hypothetical protein